MIIDLKEESNVLNKQIILGDVKNNDIYCITDFNKGIKRIVNGDMNIIFFVEGVFNNYNKDILISNLTKPDYISKIILNDNYIDLSLETGIYSVSSDTYYRIFTKSETMIKGELNGNINIKDCGTSNSSLVVKCFRFEDNHFIGEYPIVNGVYNIPNLDVNTYYNLILEDKNRIIEQQVLSYRKPTAY